MKKRYKVFLIFTVFAVVLSLFSFYAHAWETDDGNTIVYVTVSGKKYHSADCGYLRSKIEITLEEAISSGYTRCSRCKAPVYTGIVPVKETEKETTKPHSTSVSSSSSYQSTTKSSSPFAPTKTTSAKQSVQKESAFSLEAVLGILCLIGIPLFWIIKLIRKTGIIRITVVKRKRKKLKEEILQLNKKYADFKKIRTAKMPTLQSQLIATNKVLHLLQEKFYCKSDERGYPVSKDYVDGNNYGDDFTVCPGKNKYHRDNCRHSFHNRKHLLDVAWWMGPCNVCFPPIVQDWMNQYVELQRKANEIEYILDFEKEKK